MAMSVLQFRGAIREIRREIDRVALPTVRHFIGEVRKETRTKLRATSLGKALWGGRKTRGTASSRPPLVLKTIRAALSRSEGGFIGGVKITGLAANIALGKPTEPHSVRARSSGFLVFRTQSGDVIRTRSVRHPGSKVRQHPIPQAAVRRVRPKIEFVMKKQLERLFQRSVI